MLASVWKNLLRSGVVLVVVTFVVFSLMYGNGPGIARAVLGLQAEVTEDNVTAKMVELGLDRPLLTQYLDWGRGALTGDLGRSFYTGQRVTEALVTRVPVTLAVVMVALVLTALLSVLLGVTAAVRGGWADRLLQLSSILGTAVPSFITSIALVFLFAILWRVLPATGYVSPDRSLTGWIASITLPVTALLIGAVSSAAQQFRTATLDQLGKDYVRTLRARGVSERAVIFRHVLRNAAAPGLTVLSLTVFSLLGGAVFIEQVFALPGLGQLANSSAQIFDVPMVMGTVLVTAVIVLVVNFLGDLAITLLNPKARKR
ncbi:MULTISPECIES: ABC transporter permease [unclassified Actinomyces]|uniref:ABC transporter permease n=1 Tax=unclassified Actinomyces TaxID=2609248 RepID=UPI002017701D|nr:MULTISPECIES: ABC transporter permease [unclassified Actinomyces]MCL3777423.1 ABC transporter permease [Actinomyces sp. AC-20-1]MCL3790517.1 ABC transporter permease [Actinomyces sp. 187325]MCL3792095.1 ABC transporter permease [Actinomyces sp. 186855]MCL3795206.1 ABC transporter permease [Actinomyces sp. 217892]